MCSLRFVLRASVPVRRRRSCCCFESFERLPIRRSGFLCVPAVSSRWRATSVIAASASAPGAALRAAIGFRSGGVRILWNGRPSSWHRLQLLLAALRASSGFRSGGPASSGMDIRHRGIGFGSCYRCCFESFEWLPIRLPLRVPALSSVREPMWEPAVASRRATPVIAESASRREFEMMGRCYGCCCCC